MPTPITTMMRPVAGRAASTRGRRRRRRLVVVLVLALLVLVPGVSYARALTFPGSASWQMRSVEWVRDNGGSGLVNTIENWYYSRKAPSNGPPDQAALPAWSRSKVVTPSPARPRARVDSPPVIGRVVRATALPGENTWHPGRLDAAGLPAIYTAFLRPDAAHTSVVAGAAWLRKGDSTAHLVAGTRQPGGTGWPGDARVSPSDVPSLIATFNSGWKLKDITGGFYLNGRSAGPLAAGQASVVIDNRGAISVGQWGRDVMMRPTTVAVRQNLHLIVDRGRPVDGLVTNRGTLWGSARNQLQYTWRSGIGTDKSGDTVYVAGAGLTLQTLANALSQAGVVRGMELDIHSGMASFASWTPDRGGTTATPVKLLPGMSRSADRYLAPDQRDFFYLTLR